MTEQPDKIEGAPLIRPSTTDHPLYEAVVNACRTVFCLDDFSPSPAIRLPRGFRSQQVELTVRGLCAKCIPAGTQKSDGNVLRHRH